jgi:putative redox protein
MRPFGRKDHERGRRMKAISRRRNGAVLNDIDIRGHHLVADEPTEEGGEDEGPSPLELLAGSLASCTAITMQLYAERKGWDIGEVTVGVDYQPAQRGAPTRFELIVELPKELPEEQRTRLMQIAAKCPVHRTLEGEVMFEERLEVV